MFFGEILVYLQLISKTRTTDAPGVSRRISAINSYIIV